MSLKARITLLSVITVLFVAGLLLSVDFMAEERMEQRIADAVVNGNRLIWEQMLEDEQRRLAGNIEAFEKEYDLRAAMKQHDRRKIDEYAGRYVNLTQDSGSYDLLQLFDEERQLVYNSDSMRQFQNLYPLLDQVSKSGETRQGIFAAENGEVFNLVVFPQASRKRIFGLGLFARRLGGAIQGFRERTGYGIGLFGLDGAVQHQDRLPAMDGIDRQLPEPGSNRVSNLATGERIYILSAQPVLSHSGKPVAHLLVARDDTEQLRDLENFTLTIYLVTAVAVLLGVWLMFFVVGRYLAPLAKTARTSEIIAGGDLTARVPVEGVAEIRVLEQAMDRMVLNLRDMVGEIGRISGMIGDSSQRMSSTVAEAYDDSRQQHQMVEGISVAMIQMAVSIDQISQATERSAQATDRIECEAQQGQYMLNESNSITDLLNQEIEQTRQAILGLNDQVDAVAGIINVIMSIAEQTNLLALNAAIEAARAGEQGRGFAVVADEVRGLAGRTQESTREIEGIIAQLQQGAQKAVECIQGTAGKVQENADKSREVKQQFEQIRESMSELAAMSQNIATAVVEQGNMARDVSDNMASIKQVTQRANERGDGLLETSRGLSQHARILGEITRQFRYE